MLITFHPSTNPLEGLTSGGFKLCTVVLGALNIPTKETTYRADRYERTVQIVTLQLLFLIEAWRYSSQMASTQSLLRLVRRGTSRLS